MGLKFPSISDSNGPILVGQLHESHAIWVRVGKPERTNVWVLVVAGVVTAQPQIPNRSSSKC